MTEMSRSEQPIRNPDEIDPDWEPVSVRADLDRPHIPAQVACSMCGRVRAYDDTRIHDHDHLDLPLFRCRDTRGCKKYRDDTAEYREMVEATVLRAAKRQQKFTG